MKIMKHNLFQTSIATLMLGYSLYPSIRVRTAPPVSVRVRDRVRVSFSFTEMINRPIPVQALHNVHRYRYCVSYSSCVPFIDLLDQI